MSDSKLLLMESMKLITLIVYVIVALITAYILGQTLYKNGEVFIKNSLGTETHLTKPINNILLVGFYLVNLAFVLWYVSKKNTLIVDWHDALSFLTTKLGRVYVILGVWHYFNVAIILSIQFILKKYKSWKIKI